MNHDELLDCKEEAEWNDYINTKKLYSRKNVYAKKDDEALLSDSSVDTKHIGKHGTLPATATNNADNKHSFFRDKK